MSCSLKTSSKSPSHNILMPSAVMRLGFASPKSCWDEVGQRGEVHLEEEAGHLRCREGRTGRRGSVLKIGHGFL